MYDRAFGQARRRSVDNGGLALAAENQGSGHGWGGWEEWENQELEPHYAETLSDFYNQTLNAVTERHAELPPTQLPQETRAHLVHTLSNWNFEPHKLPEEHLLSCTYLLFEALYRIEGMEEEVGVSLSGISSFLCHLRQIYRWENSYHNFAHALDVLQAAHKFLCSAGMVPPLDILLEGDDRMWKPDRGYDISGSLVTCLQKHDLFVVYIAAIGHDVGHPGLTNVFMKNAQAPLSVVYDGKSPLEQMHCYLLLKVMRQHGFGKFLDKPGCGTHIRRLLWETVLATDMSVHANFMDKFEALLSPEQVPIHIRQVLICQALIKCADISNPSRPHSVSKYWASALMEEWSCQVALESFFKLPATVKPSDDPMAEAKTQIWFINTFALPLLSLTVKAVPEMEGFKQQCSLNLQTWKEQYARLESTTAPSTSAESLAPIRQPENLSNILPFTLPPNAKTLQSDDTWNAILSPHASSTSSSNSSYTSCEKGADNSDSNTASPPSSPCESFVSALSFLSPQSETSSSNHSPSSSIDGSVQSTATDCTAIIRAAFNAGPRKRKEINRNSWQPTSRRLVSNAQSAKYEWDLPAVAVILQASPRQTSRIPSPSDTIVLSSPPPLRVDVDKSNNPA